MKRFILVVTIIGLLFSIAQSYGGVIATNSVTSWLGLNPQNTYMGLSSDTKPSGSIVKLGSSFIEKDTQRVFYYDGSSWVLCENVAASDSFPRTSVGNFPGMYCKGFSEVMFLLRSVGADTVTVRPEAYFPLIGWISLAVNDTEDTRFAGNFTVGIKSFSIAGADCVLIQYVSSQGNLNYITAQYSLSNYGR